MFKHIILLTAITSFVKAEGYYCPYESLGFDGRNDLLYDYYEGNGDYWVRMGRTGWETRESYCRAKGDASLHNDAGRDKCIDSQGTCSWSGTSCDVSSSKKPDCFELCKTVKDGKGLQCLGNCPGGNSDRSQLYSICENSQGNESQTQPPQTQPPQTQPPQTQPQLQQRPRKRPSSPLPLPLPQQNKQKKMTCICSEEL
jgi:hypothetical protein